MKRLIFPHLSAITMVLAIAISLMLIPTLAQAREPGKYDKAAIFSFHFDEGKGKVVEDASGNGNNATLGGGKEPKWVDGPEPRLGTALAFKESNFIEIPESPKLDTGDDITFEAWMNLDGLNSLWSTLYSKHGQGGNAGFHWVYINKDTGKLAYQYANGAGYIAPTADVKWEFGRWTHVAITHKIDGKKGGKIQWYINGKLINEVEHKDQALRVVGGKASIGTYQSNPAFDRYALDGTLDEVRLSPRVKTEQEINESMRGLAVQPSDKLTTTWGSIKAWR
jgi:hypothetical protein